MDCNVPFCSFQQHFKFSASATEKFNVTATTPVNTQQ